MIVATQRKGAKRNTTRTKLSLHFRLMPSDAGATVPSIYTALRLSYNARNGDSTRIVDLAFTMGELRLVTNINVSQRLVSQPWAH